MDREDFFARVWDLVEQIPFGAVSTYGQIADLLGYPRYSRMVGSALRYAPEGLPCHRVVSSAGRLVPGWDEQKNLLLREGISFSSGGRVEIRKYLWKGL